MDKSDAGVVVGAVGIVIGYVVSFHFAGSWGMWGWCAILLAFYRRKRD